MKLDMKKIVVPALAICVGAAIAGSVSGTVAWYQYSTRASTAYLGTSVGASGNLQLRIKTDDNSEKWVSDLSHKYVEDWLKNNEKAQFVQPITAGALDKDDALPTKVVGEGNSAHSIPKFYRNPVAGHAAYDSWLQADEQHFVTLPLEFRYVERDGVTATVNNKKVDEKCVKQDVYLSDLLIQSDWENGPDHNNRRDLSDAIRVHIHSYQEDDNGDPINEINRLISKDGGTTVTHGKLDLDGDGDLDQTWNGTGSGAEYGFGENNQKVDIEYGEADSIQTSYSSKEDITPASSAKYYDANNEEQNETDNILPSVVNYNAGTLELSKLTYKDGDNARESKKIGSTIAFDPTDPAAEKYLQVELTIWVEGWQKFQEIDEEGNPKVNDQSKPVVSSIWDGGYIDSKFDIGFSFGCQAKDFAAHTEASEGAND